MRTSRIGRAALALTATAALAAAAMTGAAAPSSARTLSAKPGEKLAYSVTRLSAPAGKVTLRMTNKDDIAHNVALRGKKLAKPHLGKVVGANLHQRLAGHHERPALVERMDLADLAPKRVEVDHEVPYQLEVGKGLHGHLAIHNVVGYLGVAAGP